MSSDRIKVLAPRQRCAPRGATRIGLAAAWLFAGLRRVLGWRRRRRTGTEELLALASEVEPQQPSLAAELRGIAMHREAQERRTPGPLGLLV